VLALKEKKLHKIEPTEKRSAERRSLEEVFGEKAC
jgi:hypothetical protein